MDTKWRGFGDTYERVVFPFPLFFCFSASRFAFTTMERLPGSGGFYRQNRDNINRPADVSY